MTDAKNEGASGASRSDAVLAANSRYEIWDMRHEIDQARTDKQREVMAALSPVRWNDVLAATR